MFANNETGVLMPIAEIGKIARENDILFHTDAVQAVGHVPIDVTALDIDLLSISAHKFYGPKGIGALYVRQGVTIGRFMHGGAQERNVRAGTLNTPGIVGLGAAAQLAADTMEENARHERMLANRLAEGLLTLPETKLNGGDAERLPGHVNVTFGGIEAEALMTFLDLEGIAVSTGSACSSGSLKPSYVLRAMGLSIEDARGSLRMSIGRDNNVQQIDMAIQTTKAAVERLQALSPLFAQRQGGKKHV
jgi:cysteine desulfurase